MRFLTQEGSRLEISRKTSLALSSHAPLPWGFSPHCSAPRALSDVLCGHRQILVLPRGPDMARVCTREFVGHLPICIPCHSQPKTKAWGVAKNTLMSTSFWWRFEDPTPLLSPHLQPETPLDLDFSTKPKIPSWRDPASWLWITIGLENEGARPVSFPQVSPHHPQGLQPSWTLESHLS